MMFTIAGIGHREQLSVLSVYCIFAGWTCINWVSAAGFWHEGDWRAAVEAGLDSVPSLLFTMLGTVIRDM